MEPFYIKLNFNRRWWFSFAQCSNRRFTHWNEISVWIKSTIPTHCFNHFIYYYPFEVNPNALWKWITTIKIYKNGTIETNRFINAVRSVYDIHHVSNETNSTTDQMFTHQPDIICMFSFCVQRYRSQCSYMRNSIHVRTYTHSYMKNSYESERLRHSRAAHSFVKRNSHKFKRIIYTKCLDHFGRLFSADEKETHERVYFCWCHVIRDEYASYYEINDDSVFCRTTAKKFWAQFNRSRWNGMNCWKKTNIKMNFNRLAIIRWTSFCFQFVKIKVIVGKLNDQNVGEFVRNVFVWWWVMTKKNQF